MPLHDGLMSRDGWYILDDTESALLDRGRALVRRAARPSRGPVPDGYLFAYGADYVRALADFRTLTGPAPLLPRKAFGNWFSRYEGYSESDLPPLLVASFRANRVPLDVLSSTPTTSRRGTGTAGSGRRSTSRTRAAFSTGRIRWAST